MTQLARGIAGHLRQDRVKRFGQQFGWTLSSRVVAALLQMVVLALLARGLEPAGFAYVSSINVALLVVVALNGFGIQRQISYRRARDPNDERLPGLFRRRLRYTYTSAVVWLAATVALALVFDDDRWLAVVPATIWLVAEQNTQVWNSIAIADGKASQMMASFLFRRVPVVLFLVAALVEGWDIVWSWSVGLALGAVLAYLFQYRFQEPWARVLVPRRDREKVGLDLGYWWSQVGEQMRDLDVPLLTAFVDPVVAGIYALPARFVRPMNMITIATGSVAFPRLSRRKTVWRTELLAGVAVGAAPTVLIAALLFLAAPVLPLIAGDAYAGSVTTMQIVCVATALWGPCSLMVVFMQSRSDQATRAAGATVMTYNCLQLGGVVLGGILGGAPGAALAYVVGQALTLVTLTVLALRYAAPGRPEKVAASFATTATAPEQAN